MQYIWEYYWKGIHQGLLQKYLIGWFIIEYLTEVRCLNITISKTFNLQFFLTILFSSWIRLWNCCLNNRYQRANADNKIGPWRDGRSYHKNKSTLKVKNYTDAQRKQNVNWWRCSVKKDDLKNLANAAPLLKRDSNTPVKFAKCLKHYFE